MDLLKVGGMDMLDRFVWATGCSLAHPRATIDAFCRYEIPEDLLQDAGLFGPLSQITDDHKRNILANNYARVHGMGAVCVTYCVGGLSVCNSIAGAYAEKSPVLVITGSPAR